MHLQIRCVSQSRRRHIARQLGARAVRASTRISGGFQCTGSRSATPASSTAWAVPYGKVAAGAVRRGTTRNRCLNWNQTHDWSSHRRNSSWAGLYRTAILLNIRILLSQRPVHAPNAPLHPFPLPLLPIRRRPPEPHCDKCVTARTFVLPPCTLRAASLTISRRESGNSRSRFPK